MDAVTMLAISGSTAILIASLYLGDSLEHLIEVKYFSAERQDATLGFSRAEPARAVRDVERLPAVIIAEPVRAVPVRIRSGSVERRMTLYGRDAAAELNRIIGRDMHPVTPPASGVAISSWLARTLKVGPGDPVEVDLLEGRRRTVVLPVTTLIEDYIGIRAVMDLDALARLMGEEPVANQVDVRVDARQLDALYTEIKQTPAISGIALQIVSLAKFREAVALIVTAMASIYTGLAGVIAFGVVYNAARITLSEHGRELASLRIMGFGRAETFRVLLAELAILVLLAQPPGWAAGYGIALVMKLSMDADLMRMPLALQTQTYAVASAAVLVGATASALLLWRRIRELDLIAVMKTRE